MTTLLRVVSIITQGFFNPTQRNAIPPDVRECQKYNIVLTAYGTPAARCWLPQALALRTF